MLLMLRVRVGVAARARAPCYFFCSEQAIISPYHHIIISRLIMKQAARAGAVETNALVALLLLGLSVAASFCWMLEALNAAEREAVLAEELAGIRWVGLVPCGQLGNHLWEMASAHGIARARNASLCIAFARASYMQALEWKSEKEAPVACPGWVWGAPSLHSDLYHLSRFKVVGLPDGDHYARHRPDLYVDAPARNILAQGCMQSWKYLDPTTPIPFRLKAMAAAAEWVAARGLTVAIHVRRGDKVGSEGNVLTPIPYYREAMAELQRRCPSAPSAHQQPPHRYVVVTDDPEWVRAQPFFRLHTHAVLSRREDPAFDMAVIAQCRHKILSIGTFGWWGAFFTDPGHNRSQAVLYPVSQMRGPNAPGFSNADYFPPHWTPVPLLLQHTTTAAAAAAAAADHDDDVMIIV